MLHAAVPLLPRGTKIRRPLLLELSAVWPFSTPMMLRLKCCPLGAPFPVWPTAADSVPASWLPVGSVQATPASAPTARIPATAFVVRMMHLRGWDGKRTGPNLSWARQGTYLPRPFASPGVSTAEGDGLRPL